MHNKIPPPAYIENDNYNGNVFKQNNGNVFRNNNGNYGQQGMPMNNYNNNNGNANPETHRKMNAIARGNESVLNVLTGEKSPSQSYPNSSNSSVKATPKASTTGTKQHSA